MASRCSKPFALLLLVGSLLLLDAPLAGADITNLQKYYQYLRTQDQTIFAANVFAEDTTRVIHDASVTLGTVDITNNFFNFLDNTVRMNQLGEVLVAMAVFRLVQETVLPSIDAAIPTAYLPRGVSFFNPSTPSTLLTLRQLLTHTSTITDSKFDQFSKTSGAGATVESLRAFIEAYFLQTSGGTFSVATDIWFTGTPGASTSYRYAKANIALLAFIVEQAVVIRPTLVSSTAQQTVGAYLQEKILNPLGMSSTYLRNIDGSLPTLTYPSGSPYFTNKQVLDYTSAGSLMANTVIHPAYPAAYMYFTSSLDMMRLTRSLFLDVNGLWKSAGLSMKDSPILLSSSSGVTLLNGQVSQAQGIMYFDGATMCSLALASGVISKCPLLSTSSVWGHMSVGPNSQVGTFCTTAVSTTNPTCVVATLAFYDTGSTVKSLNAILGLAGAAFQEAIGVQSTVTSSSANTDTTRKLFPLWVAMGICGVILFVFVAAFITESLIQPAPISAGVPVPLPIAAKSY